MMQSLTLVTDIELLGNTVDQAAATGAGQDTPRLRIVLHLVDAGTTEERKEQIK
jgi:hypothetical protein